MSIAAIVYHLFAGIRHLITDMSIAETVASSRRAAIIVFVLTVIVMMAAGWWLW